MRDTVFRKRTDDREERQMALEKAEAYLKQAGFADRIIKLEQSTATVDLAAAALGVEPGMIAKTMSFYQGEQVILILTEGTARIDNRKYKDTFHIKAKMIPFEEVEAAVGHAAFLLVCHLLKLHFSLFFTVPFKLFFNTFIITERTYKSTTISLYKKAGQNLRSCSFCLLLPRLSPHNFSEHRRARYPFYLQRNYIKNNDPPLRVWRPGYAYPDMPDLPEATDKSLPSFGSPAKPTPHAAVPRSITDSHKTASYNPPAEWYCRSATLLPSLQMRSPGSVHLSE
jgi:hypothetical protein